MKRLQALQVKKTEARLLAYAPGGELIFYYWMCSARSDIFMPRSRCSSVESQIQFQESILFSVRKETTRLAVHEFIGVVHQLQSVSGTEVSFAGGTTVRLAHCDAYLAKIVTCSSDDGNEIADGHRQKLYYGTSASFLSKAYNQLNRSIRVFLRCSVLNS